MLGTMVFICLVVGNATSQNDTGERHAKDGEYIGCYSLGGCLEFDYHPNLLESTTPDSCTASCKEYGFKIAAIYNRTKCSCSCEHTCLKPADEFYPKDFKRVYCGLPCRSARSRVCGGFGASDLYAVTYEDVPRNTCGETHSTPVGNAEPRKPGENNNIKPYIAGGVACAGFIVLIIALCCLRRNQEGVNSPLDHTGRWRSHFASQQNEEQTPSGSHTLTDRSESPMCHPPQRSAEHATPGQAKEAVPAPDNSFYHVLVDEGEQSRCSMPTNNTYTYIDCRHMDRFPRSDASVHRQVDTVCYSENDEELEHEMVNNALYKISK